MNESLLHVAAPVSSLLKAVSGRGGQQHDGANCPHYVASLAFNRPHPPSDRRVRLVLARGARRVSLFSSVIWDISINKKTTQSSHPLRPSSAAPAICAEAKQRTEGWTACSSGGGDDGGGLFERKGGGKKESLLTYQF